MAHQHSVYDTDNHFVINPVTRAMKNETFRKAYLMQDDHNSERFTFEISRYIEEHDMSLCNVVRVHYINVDAATSDTSADVYQVDDLQLSPNSEDVVICSWLISRHATKYVGILNFGLEFTCTDESGTVPEYQWFTDIYEGIAIKDSLNNVPAVVEDYSDILEQWKKEILDEIAETGGVTDEQVENAVENYLAENPIESDLPEGGVEGQVLTKTVDGTEWADVTSGVSFTTVETLTLVDGVLSVNTAAAAEKDNTLPITSAAVHTTVGNIETLLATI